MPPLKKKKQNGPKETDIDMTPMIDIVFQLLIFFIVATQVRKVEGTLTAYLPTDSGNNPGPQQDNTQPLNIRLESVLNKKASSGLPLVDNGNETASIYYCGFDKLGTGRDGLSALHKRLSAISEKDRLKQKIIIEPQEETALWDVIQVLNICRLGEFKKISFKNKALNTPH